jgi:hypothetical protein
MRKAMLLLAIFGLSTLLWAQNPNIGTWKMNPAKSKFSDSPMRSYIIKVEAEGDGVKIVQHIIDANGKAVQRSWTAKYDGKDYPVTAPDADAISFTRPDPNTTKYVMKKNGKEAWKGQAVVSKDGKVSIDTGGGVDENGKPFTYSVYTEKQ